MRVTDSRLDEPFRPDEAVTVLGYTDEQVLSAVGDRTDSEISAAPLKLAERCQRTLPTPAWVVDVDPAAGSVPSGKAPQMTSSLVDAPRACGRVAAELTCGGVAMSCDVKVDQTVPCRARVAGCDPFTHVTFDLDAPDGACTLDPARTCRDVPLDRNSSLLGGAECDIGNETCRLSIHDLPAEPAFVVEPPILVLEGPRVELEQGYDFKELRQGPVRDFAVVGDQLVVAAADGMIHFLSAEDGSLSGTATAPPDLRMLRAFGGGFLGIHGGLPLLEVSSFDSAGRSLVTKQLDLRALIGVRDFEVIELDVDAAAAVVLLTSDTPGECRLTRSLCMASHVLELDLPTLRLSATQNFPARELSSLIRVTHDEWAAVDDAEDFVLWLDPLGGEILTSSVIGRSAAFYSFFFGAAFYDSRSELFVVSSLRPFRNVELFERGRSRGLTVFFEENEAITALAAWPANPSLVAAASYSPEGSSHFVLLDPAKPAFVLGSAPLSFSGATKMLPHGSDLWVLTNGTGELMRVHPR